MPKKCSKASKLTFPKKLFNVVNTSDYITWTEDGGSFCISDLQLFESKVMKTQFNNTSILSFFRQIQLYGFKRIVDGRRTRYQTRTNNAYFQHPNFKRGRLELLDNINREKRKRKKKSETDINSKLKIAITKYIPYGTKKRKNKSVPSCTNQIKTPSAAETQVKVNNSPKCKVDPGTLPQPLNNDFLPLNAPQNESPIPYNNPFNLQGTILHPQLMFNPFNLQNTVNFNESLMGTASIQFDNFQIDEIMQALYYENFM